jgi:hypothetical protein
MMSRTLAARMVAMGAGLAFAGVTVTWLQSEAKVVPWAGSDYVAALALLAALIGPLLALVGTIVWVECGVSRKRLTICGYLLIGCSLLGLTVTGVNIHEWTATLGPLYFTAIMIGVLCLICARFHRE